MPKTKLFQLLILVICIVGCTGQIKNSNPLVEVEEGTEIIDSSESEVAAEEKQISDITPQYEELLGAWVGYFEKDEGEDFVDNTLYVDEGYIWNRENKINITLTHVKDGKVFGRSIVAGNDRPFEGIYQELEGDGMKFQLKEPGDDRYDGHFNFTIKNGQLIGKWKAYKNIEIQNRKYQLEKKIFEYDPSIMLERAKEYVDWTNVIETKDTFEMGENEFEEWISREFASASNLIYEINASEQELDKELVENLKKGDLTIIRNTIYARHGYSYKNRPLRVVSMHRIGIYRCIRISKRNLLL